MQPVGFHHCAVQVADVEKVAAFYRSVLGLAELRRHLDSAGGLRSIWLSLGPGEAGFLAVERTPLLPAPSAGWSMIALKIDPDSRQQWLHRLAAAQVAVFKQSPFTLYLRDPEGNEVALSHHPHPAPA